MSSQTARNRFNKSAAARNIAARFPEMDLEARDLASLILGLRNKNKAGSGLDFFKYRDFENGIDNPQKIDWKASARQVNNEGENRLLIRDREMEVAQHIYIKPDFSPSMKDKKEVVHTLALAIAYITLKSGEYFTLLGSELPLRGNNTGAEGLRAELEHGIIANNDMDLPERPLHRGRPLPKNSHVFILSDFFQPIRKIAETLERLHHAKAKVHLIQILDPQDIKFQLKGHVKLLDNETGQSITIKNGQAAKEEIERRVRQHTLDIERLVNKIPGSKFSAYVTDQPLYEALLPLYGIKTDRLARQTAKPQARPV